MACPILKTVLSVKQAEGNQVSVRRSIGRPELQNLDPFLLLDEFSIDLPNAGFPDHPHRGFQTVTYMLEGAIKHEDFMGHEGIIKPGCLQWMTAGRGIVHSEMPYGELPGKGLQLWINLEKKEKMISPEYQELESSDIPVITQNKVTVKIIAGESMGGKSKIRTRTPTHFLDFNIQPGGTWKQPIESGWTVFAYIISGSIEFGQGADSPTKVVSSNNTVIFGKGEFVEFTNKDSTIDAHFVLISGRPIKETVIQRGPFVMNTWEEIVQAFDDFEKCNNGFENARLWRSKSGQ